MSQFISLFRIEALTPQPVLDENLRVMSQWIMIFAGGLLLGGVLSGYAIVMLLMKG